MTTPKNQRPGQSILLIDDEAGFLQLTGLALAHAGYQLYTALDGHGGVQQFFEHQPDLVIVDLVMPGLDGWEICRRLRRLSTVPLMILSGLGGAENIIRGLEEVGADDYLTKPVDLKVLLAKVRALLRRVALPPPSKETLLYEDGYLTLDLIEGQVRVRGQWIELSRREYELLAYLYRHAGRLCSYRQILRDVWGWPEDHGIDVIHNNVQRLRQKLEEDPRQPRYLLTQYGVGYRFRKQSSF